MNENIPELIGALPFYDRLSSAQRELFERSSAVRSYHAGQLLAMAGECLGMSIVLDGCLRASVISEDGREITLFRVEKGGICVMSASCVMSQITFETQIMSECESRILIIGSSAISTVSKENVHLRCYIYELMCERFSSVMWTMQQILFAKFDRRLADFLLSEYERTGKREIAMTHEQIAVQVSSAREVVARMLKRFVADQLVELKRGTVRLIDIEGLENL